MQIVFSSPSELNHQNEKIPCKWSALLFTPPISQPLLFTQLDFLVIWIGAQYNYMIITFL